MKASLGIDTSNYTTSTALLGEDGTIQQCKKQLQVASGDLGLRQNDAVFAHVKQLGGLLENLFEGNEKLICAVGCASYPRDSEDSYMPCFLSGKMVSQSVAAVLGVPLFEFSHQAGHIAAALFETKQNELFEREFLAFHVSGGTTQCLLVQPDETGKKPFKIAVIAESLDLYAGQLIDRTGAILGLSFPSGPALEELAKESGKRFPVKIAFKGLDCCLSGVENQCRKLLSDGEESVDVARFCIDSIERAVFGMTMRVIKKYPGRRIVYSGGVMGNSIIRDSIEKHFDAVFASPGFSSDNAAGIAVLCEKSYQKSLGKGKNPI